MYINCTIHGNMCIWIKCYETNIGIWDKGKGYEGIKHLEYRDKEIGIKGKWKRDSDKGVGI